MPRPVLGIHVFRSDWIKMWMPGARLAEITGTSPVMTGECAAWSGIYTLREATRSLRTATPAMTGKGKGKGKAIPRA